MTGQAERSTKKKQPSRSKARGLNSSNEASNVTLEDWPSWGQLGVNMSQHGPTWGYLGAILGLSWACLDQLGPTWANMGPTWGQLGATWGNLGQLGPTWGLLRPARANMSQRGPTWGQLEANPDEQIIDKTLFYCVFSMF